MYVHLIRVNKLWFYWADTCPLNKTAFRFVYNDGEYTVPEFAHLLFNGNPASKRMAMDALRMMYPADYTIVYTLPYHHGTSKKGSRR